MESAGAFGLYVHVPYCRARCHYCAFVFEPGHRAVPDDYVGRLEREIGRRAEDPRFAGRPVDSIYFGGGTPSLLTPKQMERVLAAARSRFAVAAAAEVSFEANPDRLETERLRGFRAVGANRLTLGWQALRAGHLSSLTRTHRPAENLRALERARRASGTSAWT